MFSKGVGDRWGEIEWGLVLSQSIDHAGLNKVPIITVSTYRSFQNKAVYTEKLVSVHTFVPEEGSSTYF
jgi:hypothetical protein